MRRGGGFGMNRGSGSHGGSGDSFPPSPYQETSGDKVWRVMMTSMVRFVVYGTLPMIGLMWVLVLPADRPALVLLTLLLPIIAVFAKYDSQHHTYDVKVVEEVPVCPDHPTEFVFKDRDKETHKQHFTCIVCRVRLGEVEVK